MSIRKLIFLIACLCACTSMGLYVFYAMGGTAFANSIQRILAPPVKAFLEDYDRPDADTYSGQAQGKLEMKSSDVFDLNKAIHVLPQCMAGQNLFALTFLVSITAIWFSRRKCQRAGALDAPSSRQ